ncbi:M56 family metallopeptidase [Flammeovirgaceae bacterium SG7u.111]|nr:M56 family metallopeptidase [Flammeovirgaceae bacterium SG7u.132]WPO33512.1 M56 family metallopeptidase [Flammeovirgaceae bacterium SG7u.111]
MNNIIEALSVTILHSLWQGLLIAVILGISLKILRKHSAQKRYFTSIAALFLLATVSIATFFISYQSEGTSTVLTDEAITNLEAADLLVYYTQDQSILAKVQATYQSIVSLIKTYSSTIFVVWLVGVGFFSLRFISGLYYIQKIRTQKVSPVSVFWEEKLNAMCQKIGIRSKVKMLKSSMVEVPTVVGWLRPVILMPISMMAQMPVPELEGVLAHELAHIRRNDYLLNMIQSIIEIVLFYNPAAWWISVCINDERENCCDDIALQATGSAKDYIKALANLAQAQYREPELALSVMGKRGSVLYRIRRIVAIGQNQFETAHALSQRTIGRFAAAMLVLCALIFFTLSSGYKESQAQDVPFEERIASAESLPVVEEFTSPDDTTKKQVKVKVMQFASNDSMKVTLSDPLSWTSEETIVLDPADSSHAQVFFLESDGDDAGIWLSEEEELEIDAPLHMFMLADDTSKKKMKYKIKTIEKKGKEGENVFFNVHSSNTDSTVWVVNVETDSTNNTKSFKYRINATDGYSVEVDTLSEKGKRTITIHNKDSKENSVIIDYKNIKGKKVTELKGKGNSIFTFNDEEEINGKKVAVEYKGIHIRSADGDKKPLYILDGEEISQEELENIAPEKIAFMNVLKGNSAIDKYGEKGKNGVVEITLSDKIIEQSKKTIQIRSLDDNKQPLFIIDGKEVSHGFIKTIDPDNIKQLDVHKGEIAIHYFGEKGKNGVVEITLKEKNKAEEKIQFPTFKDGKTPLFILDGNEISKEKIPIEIIESINVLKGEKAIEKYGEKAKDGVLEVKSKSNFKIKEKAKVKVKNTEQLDLSQTAFFIDGIESDLEEVNQLKKGYVIEKVEVLKGKENVEKYGVDAENIMLITTKSGKGSSNLSLEFSSKSAFANSIATYPNPTDGVLNIGFKLAEKERVKVDIYNLSGKKVDTILNKSMPAGIHEVTWDSKDYGSGAYILHIKTNGETVERKILVNK